MSIYPWNQVGTNGSPFVLTFQHMGITFAASILNFVVLTASLSAINSDVFGVGRMLHGMAEQGARRKFCQNVTPWYSVGHCTGDDDCAAVCGLPELHHAGKRLPGDCFAGDVCDGMGMDYDPAVANRLPSSFTAGRGKALKFKVPGGVVTTIAGLIFLVFIIALIGYHPDTRISLYVGFAWIVLLLIGWIFKRRRDRQLAQA